MDVHGVYKLTSTFHWGVPILFHSSPTKSSHVPVAKESDRHDVHHSSYWKGWSCARKNRDGYEEDLPDGYRWLQLEDLGINLRIRTWSYVSTKGKAIFLKWPLNIYENWMMPDVGELSFFPSFSIFSATETVQHVRDKQRSVGQGDDSPSDSEWSCCSWAVQSHLTHLSDANFQPSWIRWSFSSSKWF